LLQTIERATRQPIEEMALPSVEDVNDQRIMKFKQRIGDALAREDDRGLFRQLIEQYQSEHDVPAIEIAAALALLAQGDAPFLLSAPERNRRSVADEHVADRGDRSRRREQPLSSRRKPGPMGFEDSDSSFRRDRKGKMDPDFRRDDSETKSRDTSAPSSR